MAWLAENWIWVAFGVAFIAMHLFGHRGHGGHGGHGGQAGQGGHCGHGNRDRSKPPADEPARDLRTAARVDRDQPHRH